MPLRDLQLKPAYFYDSDNLLEDFYIPVLNNSIQYDRISGFFCSNALAVAAIGLGNFFKNGGTIRLICNIVLSNQDQDAIRSALADSESQVLHDLNNLESELQADHVGIFAWLLKSDRLQLRIAAVMSGIEHRKCGILHDLKGDIVCFSGTDNETMKGWLQNDENFHVYCSWLTGDDRHYGPEIEGFEALWSDRCARVKTYNPSEAFRLEIIQKAPRDDEEFATLSDRATRQLLEAHHRQYRPSTNGVADLKALVLSKLWHFQIEAVQAFVRAKYRGILSMATGSGKTRTAIGCMLELLTIVHKKIFVVVVAPQFSILQQWRAEIQALSFFERSIVADSTFPDWDDSLSDNLKNLRASAINSFVLFTTYNTFSSARFTALLKAQGNASTSFLLCDEVHWSGAPTFRSGLLESYTYRLGLSATPSRHMDEEGTDYILEYFGQVFYEFSLERALTEINPSTGQTFLCHYSYYPVFVSLTEEELKHYSELTSRISVLCARDRDRPDIEDLVQRLCEERARVIENAERKMDALRELLDGQLKHRAHQLFYCSPEQIDGVQGLLNNSAVPHHRFTGDEGTKPKREFSGRSEREQILDLFEKGKYKALVAMKCLDEGVNIVRAATGVLLASSGNPRQYIQRRGRLLRRHPDKECAEIFDTIALPYSDPEKCKNTGAEERRLIEKQLIRYEEFSQLADNHLQAMNMVHQVKRLFGLL